MLENALLVVKGTPFEQCFVSMIYLLPILSLLVTVAAAYLIIHSTWKDRG